MGRGIGKASPVPIRLNEKGASVTKSGLETFRIARRPGLNPTECHTLLLANLFAWRTNAFSPRSSSTTLTA